MPNQPHKIFLKGEEADFVVFVEDADLLAKYRKNDTTIPIIDIVSIYKIFANRSGGAEGVFDEASKSELSNQFGTSDRDVVIKKILLEGTDKRQTTIHRGYGGHNDSIGNGNSGN
ncbi:ribosome maturation protein [Scheffersomyces amazonensis]|uniref:ribosome maturation protein n=1 Tax=Scheffersomyces amazonensis TaxID=1078765 RepID=UPI00315DE115